MNPKTKLWLKRLNLVLVVIITLQLICSFFATKVLYKQMGVDVDYTWILACSLSMIIYGVCAYIIHKKETKFVRWIIAELVFMALCLYLIGYPLMQVIQSGAKIAS